jgi:hypothetical protein
MALNEPPIELRLMMGSGVIGLDQPGTHHEPAAPGPGRPHVLRPGRPERRGDRRVWGLKGSITPKPVMSLD